MSTVLDLKLAKTELSSPGNPDVLALTICALNIKKFTHESSSTKVEA